MTKTYSFVKIADEHKGNFGPFIIVQESAPGEKDRHVPYRGDTALRIFEKGGTSIVGEKEITEHESLREALRPGLTQLKLIDIVTAPKGSPCEM